MGIKAKLTLIAGLMIVSVASSAVADKLCLQTTVNKKTFKATNKSVVAATCPKGYTVLADTSSFQGPAGATGSKGILNLGSCRLVSGTCYHAAGVNSCTVNCNNGEFALQYGHVATGSGCNPNPGSGTASYSLVYPNGLGAGILLYSSATCNYDVIINVLCCPTS